MDCGHLYCCGLLSSGYVKCWGEADEPSGRRPWLPSHAADMKFRTIWVGTAAICGRLIDGDEDIVCW
jgi:hypothetical protein